MYSQSEPTPSSMKAMVYDKKGPNRISFQSDHAVPTPAQDQVLVKVASASMNPVDFRIADRKNCFRKYPSRVVGSDFSGTIIATGRFVRGFAVGDHVFGFGAGYASYTLANVNEIAKIPEGQAVEGFGIYGLAGTAAHQILRKHWLDRPNFNARSLLVIGASGGVGSSLVQMARAYGGPELKIYAIASGKNCEYARNIGANESADYTQRDFDIARAFPVHSMDLIIDLVSGSPESTDYIHAGGKLLLKPRGKYVVVNSMSFLARFRSRMSMHCGCDWQRANFDLFHTQVHHSDTDLQAVARLVQQRKLFLEVTEEVPLLETPIRKALHDLRLRHIRGKIRIRPTEFGSEEQIPFQSPTALRASGS